MRRGYGIIWSKRGATMPPPNSRRLHPATLLLAAVGAIRPFIIPIIAVLIFGGAQYGLIFLGVFVVLAMIRALVRYVSFTYRLDAAELVTTEGLLERAERHIPLERVQDVRLEQGLLHRLFGVVDVHVETAAGQGAEASLSVLSRAEAERLRQAVFAHGREAGAQLAEAGAPAPEPAAELSFGR